jgi:hypothetical protein
MTGKKVKINRAPVLTLWATVVAARLGYDRNAALTLGKAVAGLNAQSKGRRLGIFEEPQEKDKEPEKQPKAAKASELTPIPLLGRLVTVAHTDDGLRAVTKGQPISPDSVSRYLKQKFGENLPDVQEAMETLAKAYRPAQLEKQAYALYEQFRPAIPEGKSGWGAAGELDLDKIHSLAKTRAS